MIQLTTPSGAAHYVAANNIARITEAAASSQWHGIRAFVRCFDGETLECSEPADSIRRMVEAAQKESA